MTPVHEAARHPQARINRRRSARDHCRAKAVAEILGVEWDSLDEAGVKSGTTWHTR